MSDIISDYIHFKYSNYLKFNLGLNQKKGMSANNAFKAQKNAIG
jgi:hypothetical protein